MWVLCLVSSGVAPEADPPHLGRCFVVCVVSSALCVFGFLEVLCGWLLCLLSVVYRRLCLCVCVVVLLLWLFVSVSVSVFGLLCLRWLSVWFCGEVCLFWVLGMLPPTRSPLPGGF